MSDESKLNDLLPCPCCGQPASLSKGEFGGGWIAKEEGMDLKWKLIVADARQTEYRNHAIQLADALMDINNLVGEDEHVKQAVMSVDEVMREYAGLELE